MYSINKYILLVVFFSITFSSFGQSNFFRKIGIGLETQMGLGVEGTPIISTFNSSESSQIVDTTLNITLGLDGRADLWALRSKNLGYAYFGEISRGWLLGRTHAFFAHGHHAFIRVRKIRIDAEVSQRNRTTIISINNDGDSYWYKNGEANFKNIDRYQIGITFGEPKGFRFGIAAFREYFVDNELVATGGKISFIGEKVSFIISGTLDHPVFNVNNPAFSEGEVATIPRFNATFRMPISFHKKSYAQLLSRR